MSKRLLIAMLLSSAPLPALAGQLDNLDQLSLDSLGKIVTSVSKKPEDSFRSPAAIYVISNDDIKASGATHIAEVLRGVPGLDVARLDSSNWAISSRGFNDLFSNKMLVLVDGRTIYTPIFSGVYWDIQNMPLEDIDRVEVIRGPGASLWGANAVNGVINIITKRAEATQGIYASTVVGNQDRSINDVRYGGKLNDDLYYRTYAKYDNRQETRTTARGPGNNDWDNVKAGFRADWDVSESRKITLQGDVYDADINLDLFTPTLSDPSGINAYHDKIDSKGFNMLGRWDEKHSNTLSSTFQAYVDYQSPSYSSLEQKIYTFDLDYQTLWKADERNEIMWGLGSRYIASDLTGSDTIIIAKPIDSETILSAFVQDQYALVPKELYVTLGSKFEHNDFSGFEIEPSARIAWYPDNKQTVWAAVSRAVRTPGIAERSWFINLQAQPPLLAQQRYSNSYTSEELMAYEVGYRVKPTQKVTVDSTAFINDYSKLRTFEPGDLEFPGADIIAPYNISNVGSGKAYGFETSVNWDVTKEWSLLANYSYINMVLDSNGSQDPTFLSQEGRVPHHQISLRSQLYLPHDVRLVNTAYYTDELPADSIDSYIRFDTQVIWQATNNIEVSLVGQNLLDSKHPEFGAPLDGVANEIPRAFYGRLTLRY